VQRIIIRGVLLSLLVVFMAVICYGASATGSEDSSSSTAVEKKKAKKRSFPGQENLIDINTASADQLKALPGLNDDDVRKIIAGRPYARKNQLKQKKIISAAVYDGIKSSIVAKKTPR
jgi:competence protein ComEA